MSNTIFKSSIWLETLDEKSSYSEKFKEDVEILRSSFKDIRKKAEVIAGHINESQPGLTLHDISHLDSLWETAHTIAGQDLNLNPVEAYIFGCSVLFHDLGKAVVLCD
jgi:HD superfamily phosphodiesterase